MRNAMSVDVEDYYHVWALQAAFPRESWPRLSRRVGRNTDRLLDVFEAAGVSATFFVLGCVARDNPDLVRRIARRGHEVASHGFAHHKVGELSPDAFLADVRETRQRLADLSGQAVRGYRAPSFSVNERTPWAYGCLAEAGYGYSSSLHPIAHDHYGGVTAPRAPHRVPGLPLVEIPVATVSRLGRRVSCAGGGHFRLLPYAWTAANLHRLNGEGQPGGFYLHPWEIDPGQPRARDVPLRGRLRHYTGLRACEGKLLRLLRDFAWARYDSVYADILGEAAVPVSEPERAATG
jgi:polysaccharide deacetylase family protein (PEP-CTERM system associated)